ncbi:His/Gly/Thr/Pro-type tRNA ligase C-terminal domain-containing protein [Streptomyces achmelvichensis]|uniref:His/Gly/Thr/Pro-type tRNA ligase C-terminal domain-containing protein n=1 Tax=Streptomyces achmelvichensis TaxID=3134111 RepID=UPI003C12B816
MTPLLPGVPRSAELMLRAVEQGLRAELVGPEHGSLGARIRGARLVPHQAVIGLEEADDDLVALRLRDGRRLKALSADEVLARIGVLVAGRSGELWDTPGE